MHDQNTEHENQSMSFEQSLQQLEMIVDQLEQGQLGLSESIEKYEQGVKLLNHCHQALEQVERKIQILTRVDEDGRAFVENVEEDTVTTDIDEGGRARKRRYGSESSQEKSTDVDDNRQLF